MAKWKVETLVAPGRYVADQALEALLADAEVGLDICGGNTPKPIWTEGQKIATAWASFAVIQRTLIRLLDKEEVKLADD